MSGSDLIIQGGNQLLTTEAFRAMVAGVPAEDLRKAIQPLSEAAVMAKRNGIWERERELIRMRIMLEGHLASLELDRFGLSDSRWTPRRGEPVPKGWKVYACAYDRDRLLEVVDEVLGRARGRSGRHEYGETTIAKAIRSAGWSTVDGRPWYIVRREIPRQKWSTLPPDLKEVERRKEAGRRFGEWAIRENEHRVRRLDNDHLTISRRLGDGLHKSKDLAAAYIKIVEAHRAIRIYRTDPRCEDGTIADQRLRDASVSLYAAEVALREGIESLPDGIEIPGLHGIVAVPEGDDLPQPIGDAGEGA